jgi:hypothetical protein
LHPSVAATHNGVKNFFEIGFSLRRRSKQRLAFPHVARRANRAIEGERMPQLFVGFGATPLVDELLGGTQPEERFVRDDAHALEEIRGSAKVSGSSSRVTGAPNSAITASPMNFSTVPPRRSNS